MLEASKANPFSSFIPVAKCQGHAEDTQALVKSRVIGAAAVVPGGKLQFQRFPHQTGPFLSENSNYSEFTWGLSRISLLPKNRTKSDF